MSHWLLNKYALDIAKGAVFAYPTDTIWGLGCHPDNPYAVKRILAIKQRPHDKGMILLSSHIDFCEPYIHAEYFQKQYHQIETPDIQPTTWLLPASIHCPSWLTGKNSTVAIRITRLAHIRALCEKRLHPLISTSANISGRAPASNLHKIRKLFLNKVDFIVAGIDPLTQRPSKIIDKRTGETIRP